MLSQILTGTEDPGAASISSEPPLNKTLIPSNSGHQLQWRLTPRHCESDKSQGKSPSGPPARDLPTNLARAPLKRRHRLPLPATGPAGSQSTRRRAQQQPSIKKERAASWSSTITTTIPTTTQPPTDDDHDPPRARTQNNHGLRNPPAAAKRRQSGRPAARGGGRRRAAKERRRSGGG